MSHEHFLYLLSTVRSQNVAFKPENKFFSPISVLLCIGLNSRSQSHRTKSHHMTVKGSWQP